MVTIKEIASQINQMTCIGNVNQKITSAVPLISSSHNLESLTWCGPKNKLALENFSKGNVLVNAETFDYVHLNCASFESVNWLIAENPRRVFAEILNKFFVEQLEFGQIGSNTTIDDTVVFDKSVCRFGNNVSIEKNVKIGRNVVVGHGTVIHSGTEILDNVKIGSNCVIGGVGFGYERNEKGEYDLIPHIGNVVLCDNVEVGNNVCIDRAVMGSTLLHNNVKVDNLVHIAHGVEIGENSLIIANAMIAGSVKIGKNVWVAPSSSIIQKVKIGDDALIGMSATVLKDVEKGSVMIGSPAKKLTKK